MNLTVIIACKNRYKNLSYCLASINKCNPVPRVVLVDYGNKRRLAPYADYYKWLRVIRVDRNTNTFHKTRALNIGIKHAETKYVCLTDVDQIFNRNFFKVVNKKLEENNNSFVRCKTFFSKKFPDVEPRKFDMRAYNKLLDIIKKKPFKKSHGEGCCHGVIRKWLLEVRGHDELYIGWGFEDKDLVLRASISGFIMTWIDGETDMIHLPHDRDNEYFSYKFRKNNEDRYNRKNHKCDVVVNLNRSWGEL